MRRRFLVAFSAKVQRPTDFCRNCLAVLLGQIFTMVLLASSYDQSRFLKADDLSNEAGVAFICVSVGPPRGVVGQSAHWHHLRVHDYANPIRERGP